MLPSATIGRSREIPSVKQSINPPTLPTPGGSYSQVVRRANLVFVAGMVGRDMDKRLAGDDVRSQTRQALENVRAGLAAAGAALDDVCSVTAFLEHADEDFAGYDEVYREFFQSDPPARATVQAHLLGGVLVEIQAIAVLEQ
jgi:2-iminobutanoate/2-iminopropanoate deaminase